MRSQRKGVLLNMNHRKGEIMLYPNMVAVDVTSNNDFGAARFRAKLRSMITRLLGKCNNLLSLDAVLDGALVKGQHALGIRTVPINEIVGSSGRADDFDRAFYPRRDLTRQRWVHINQANQAGVELPPVELRKIGEQYFVMDGHHRISVARQRGQRYIDAQVVEMVIARRM